jgi:hypothetical protein
MRKLHDKVMNTEIAGDREREIDGLEQARLRMSPLHVAVREAGPRVVLVACSPDGDASVAVCLVDPGSSVCPRYSGGRQVLGWLGRRAGVGSADAVTRFPFVLLDRMGDPACCPADCEDRLA